MHRWEIERLIGRMQRKGLTLIPTRIYFKGRQAKVELALARGKQAPDKRRDDPRPRRRSRRRAGDEAALSLRRGCGRRGRTRTRRDWLNSGDGAATTEMRVNDQGSQGLGGQPPPQGDALPRLARRGKRPSTGRRAAAPAPRRAPRRRVSRRPPRVANETPRERRKREREEQKQAPRAEEKARRQREREEQKRSPCRGEAFEERRAARRLPPAPAPHPRAGPAAPAGEPRSAEAAGLESPPADPVTEVFAPPAGQPVPAPPPPAPISQQAAEASGRKAKKEAKKREREEKRTAGTS